MSLENKSVEYVKLMSWLASQSTKVCTNQFIQKVPNHPITSLVSSCSVIDAFINTQIFDTAIPLWDGHQKFCTKCQTWGGDQLIGKRF